MSRLSDSDSNSCKSRGQRISRVRAIHTQMPHPTRPNRHQATHPISDTAETACHADRLSSPCPLPPRHRPWPLHCPLPITLSRQQPEHFGFSWAVTAINLYLPLKNCVRSAGANYCLARSQQPIRYVTVRWEYYERCQPPPTSLCSQTWLQPQTGLLFDQRVSCHGLALKPNVLTSGDGHLLQ